MMQSLRQWLLQVPLVMAQQQAHETVCQALQITKAGPLNLVEWKDNLADRWDGLSEVQDIDDASKTFGALQMMPFNWSARFCMKCYPREESLQHVRLPC